MNKIVMLNISFEYNKQTHSIHPVILFSEKDVVLVDCGYPGFLPLIEAEMQANGVDPNTLTKVLITHHDDDHMGSLFELKEKYPNIKVITSEIESDYVSGRKKSLRLLQAEQVFNNLPENQKQFGLDFCERLKRVKPIAVDITVKEGDHFDWAGGCVVIATPGHLPGHISLYLQEEKAIITGDAAVVENGNLVIANPHFTLDLELAESSLNKIVSMGVESYYCYHGGKFTRS